LRLGFVVAFLFAHGFFVGVSSWSFGGIQMIIAISIAVGVAVGWLLYRVLFYDLADFFDGFMKLSTVFLVRRRRWPFAPRSKVPTPEDFEDDSWSSGIRFFFFLAGSVGSGYFTYSELQRHFG
jgi:hypothetical protein